MASKSTEQRITELAARQHGLVTRGQLLAAGVGVDAVKHRVTTGRLRPVQRGVYRMGPLVGPQEREMAAVLACGPDAVISHRSAAALWELLPRPDEADPVDITVPARSRRRRPGVRVYRRPALARSDVAKLDGIPTTAAARTLLDLAATVAPRELEQAVAQGERLGLVSRARLASRMRGSPRRAGARALRALLDEGTALALTRSEAEARFLELVRRAQLPVPETNVALWGYEVDFLWRRQSLAVEVDGFAFHSSRSRFERDRLKDARLSARGLRVVRVTWHQIVREPEATLVRLVQTLALGA